MTNRLEHENVILQYDYPTLGLKFVETDGYMALFTTDDKVVGVCARNVGHVLVEVEEKIKNNCKGCRNSGK